MIDPARPSWMPMAPSHLAFVLTAAGLAVGLVAQLAGWVEAAALAWAAAAAVALVPLAYTVVRGLFSRKAGVDFIALLAMGGALILQEYLAGAVIALMLTGGRALEDFAASRARRELSALVQRTPRIVHRCEDEAIVSAGIETVRPGDTFGETRACHNEDSAHYWPASQDDSKDNRQS